MIPFNWVRTQDWPVVTCLRKRQKPGKNYYTSGAIVEISNPFVKKAGFLFDLLSLSLSSAQQRNFFPWKKKTIENREAAFSDGNLYRWKSRSFRSPLWNLAPAWTSLQGCLEKSGLWKRNPGGCCCCCCWCVVVTAVVVVVVAASFLASISSLAPSQEKYWRGSDLWIFWHFLLLNKHDTVDFKGEWEWFKNKIL